MYTVYIILLLVILLVTSIHGACEDKSKIRFLFETYDGKSITTCAELVEHYPEYCERIGREGGECCQACKKVGTPGCLDTLSMTMSSSITNHVTGQQTKVSSCATVVSIFPAFCAAKAWGGPGKRCCHSCQAACTDTLDTSQNITVPGVGNVLVSSCSRLVEDYPVMCEEMGVIGGACCYSCKKAGSPGCLDKLSPVYRSYLKRTLENGTTILAYQTSCKTVLSDFPLMCHEEAWGGPGKVCCHTCDEGRKYCWQLRNWTLSSKKICDNCTCNEIIERIGAKKMAKLCKINKGGKVPGNNNLIGIRDGCCLLCKHLQYEYKKSD